MWTCLNEFAQNNNLCFRDFTLPLDTFTYLTPAHKSTSRLDHVLTSRKLQIRDVDVLYSAPVFDHFQLPIEIEVESLSYIPLGDLALKQEFVDWIAFTEGDKETYNFIFTSMMNDFETGIVKRILNHVWINDIYSKIFGRIKIGTNYKLNYYSKTFTPVPGWNDHCRRKYKLASEAFLKWVEDFKINYMK